MNCLVGIGIGTAFRAGMLLSIPVAHDTSFTVAADKVDTIPAPGVLTGASGGQLSAVKDTNPSHGTLTLNASGSFIYTPTANYQGADSFTYHAHNILGDSGTQTATLTVVRITTHFVVQSPSTAGVGTGFSFTVTAQNVVNNNATSYAGTVQFTSSDGLATLPANTTLVSGTGTFSATLNTVGSQTLTATDLHSGAITGTSSAIAVSSFTDPSSIPGLALSLNSLGGLFQDTGLTTPAVSNGDPVGSMAGQYGTTINAASSGNTHRLTLATNSLNGKSTLTAVSTSNAALSATLTLNDFTAFLILDWDSVAEAALGYRNDLNQYLYDLATNGGASFYDGTLASYNKIGALPNHHAILVLRRTGTTIRIMPHGIYDPGALPDATVSGASLSIQQLLLLVGAFDSLDIYTRSLSMSEISDYLTKWSQPQYNAPGPLTTVKLGYGSAVSGGYEQAAYSALEQLDSTTFVATYSVSNNNQGTPQFLVFSKSTDGGCSWVAKRVTPTLPGGSVVGGNGTGMALLGNGVLMWPFQVLSGIFVVNIISSSDGGNTFSDPPVVIGPPTGYANIIASGKILDPHGDASLLLLPCYGENNVSQFFDAFMMQSTDGGTNWSLRAVMIAGTSGTPHFGGAPEVTAIRVGATSTLVCMADNNNSGATGTLVAISADLGLTWGSTSQVTYPTGVIIIAPIGIYTQAGNVVVVGTARYAGGPNFSGMYAVKSPDAGVTWGSWVQVIDFYHNTSAIFLGYGDVIEVAGKIWFTWDSDAGNEIYLNSFDEASL